MTKVIFRRDLVNFISIKLKGNLFRGNEVTSCGKGQSRFHDYVAGAQKRNNIQRYVTIVCGKLK